MFYMHKIVGYTSGAVLGSYLGCHKCHLGCQFEYFAESSQDFQYMKVNKNNKAVATFIS